MVLSVTNQFTKVKKLVLSPSANAVNASAFPHGDSAEEAFSGFMKQEDISSFSPLGLGWNTIDGQRMSTAQIHPFSDVYDVFWLFYDVSGCFMINMIPIWCFLVFNDVWIVTVRKALPDFKIFQNFNIFQLGLPEKVDKSIASLWCCRIPCFQLLSGVSINGGTPIAGWFIMENPIKII